MFGSALLYFWYFWRFFCIIASSYSSVISLNPLVFVLYRSRYLEILPKCFIGESILSVDGTYCMRFELNKCDMFDKFHLIDHYFWLFFWRKFVYIFLFFLILFNFPACFISKWVSVDITCCLRIQLDIFMIYFVSQMPFNTWHYIQLYVVCI